MVIDFFQNRLKIKKLQSALEDISAKMSELQKRNNSMKAVIKSMAEGVIVTDKSLNILAINNSAEGIFDISKKDAEEKFLLEVIPNSEISDIVKKALDNARTVSSELVLAMPVSGTFMINASPIIEAGNVTGCVLVIHDITELRKLETMRSDFVANVSHELKTPLTSIKGFIETLLDGALKDEKNAKEFLNIVNDHVNRLDSLVNDLLSLSYLESDKAVLDKGNVKLKGLADKVILGFSAQAKKKDVRVINDISAGVSVKVDQDKMEQVFTNLIDNAVKFNNSGGSVKISCEDAKNSIKVTVQDSGPGIPLKDIPRIFERFYRVDKARSRELGGTGLGLSIVKHIIKLHSGDAGVESTEGAGSVFWFTLPK